eukprot:132521-Chlamydomonas_euryale.AAC.1
MGSFRGRFRCSRPCLGCSDQLPGVAHCVLAPGLLPQLPVGGGAFAQAALTGTGHRRLRGRLGGRSVWGVGGPACG